MTKVIATDLNISDRVAEAMGIYAESYNEKALFGKHAIVEAKNTELYLEEAELTYNLMHKLSNKKSTKNFSKLQPGLKRKLEMGHNSANYSLTKKAWGADFKGVKYRTKATARNLDLPFTDEEARVLYGFISRYPAMVHYNRLIRGLKHSKGRRPATGKLRARKNVFICDTPGTNSYAYSEAGLAMGATAIINGTTDLGGIVKFNNSGYVRDICLKKNPSFLSAFDYEIAINAKGPKGISGGSGYTYYMDKAYDSYMLSVYRSGMHEHVVDFNSSNPEISLITWSNKRINGYDPLFTWITQRGYFSDLFYVFGFFRTADGVYHARQDALQQYGGYNSVYDMVFDAVTSMNRARFFFKVGGKEYAIWAWKGNYLNLGAGAELGIYERWGTTDHYIVNHDLELPMTLELYDTRFNKKIIEYRPKEKQWWITGFNPTFIYADAKYLKAVYTVDFSSKKNFYEAFKSTIKNTPDYANMGWSFNDRTYVATFNFTKGMSV